MTKKLLAFFLMLCIGFVSCTPVVSPFDGEQKPSPDAPLSDVPTSPSEQPPEQPNRIDLLVSNAQFDVWETQGMILTFRAMVMDVSSSERFPLCYDPLCDHSTKQMATCIQQIMPTSQGFCISQKESTDSLVLYIRGFSLVRDPATKHIQPQFFFMRYDQANATQDKILENFKPLTCSWSMDTEAERIYHIIYHSEGEDEDGGNAEPELWLCELDIRTRENRLICKVSEQVIARYIEDDVLYLMGVSGQYFAVDLRAEAPEMKKYRDCDGFMTGGYHYTFETVETVTVTVPEEMVALSEQYETKTEEIYEIKNLYRVPVSDPSAEPELVLERIAGAAVKGNTILYTIQEPKYHYSYLRAPWTNKAYRLDDPEAPPDCTLIHVFTKNSETQLLRFADLETKEVFREIDLSRYSTQLSGCFWSEDGEYFINQVTVNDIEHRIETSGNQAKLTYCAIPLNKDVLTDEDVIFLKDYE